MKIQAALQTFDSQLFFWRKTSLNRVAPIPAYTPEMKSKISPHHRRPDSLLAADPSPCFLSLSEHRVHESNHQRGWLTLIPEPPMLVQTHWPVLVGKLLPGNLPKISVSCHHLTSEMQCCQLKGQHS